MNQELATVLKMYATKPHKELNDYLIGKSKDNLIGILSDLITMYINDKNSSTIREFITVTLAGYNHIEKKIGYNGFKQDTFSGTTIRCEAKPKNCDTNAEKPEKLRGAGNFSDYTFARLEKDIQEKGLNILVSGFVDGFLIYILEFPFSHAAFVQRLEKQLWKRFPLGKDIKNEYLRSADFHYRHFIDCLDLRVVYLLEKGKLEKYKACIVRDFYKFIEGKAK